LSPSNKDSRGIDALDEKFTFYETYGIQEYYIYDPDDLTLAGWQRQGDRLTPILSMSNWVSPLLGIRFDWVAGTRISIISSRRAKISIPCRVRSTIAAI